MRSSVETLNKGAAGVVQLPGFCKLVVCWNRYRWVYDENAFMKHGTFCYMHTQQPSGPFIRYHRRHFN